MKSQLYKTWLYFRRNHDRVLEVVFWPVITLVGMAFFITFVSKDPAYVAVAFLGTVGARVLWAAMEVGNTVQEEIYSQSLPQLVITPIKKWELVAAGLVSSAVKTSIVVLVLFGIWMLFMPLAIRDWALLLAGGIALFGFAATTALLILALMFAKGPRYGLLGWTLPEVIGLMSGVWYPVSVFPPAMQMVAYALPPTYGFECLRASASIGTANVPVMLLLTAAYLAVAYWLFSKSFDRAHKSGRLAKTD